MKRRPKSLLATLLVLAVLASLCIAPTGAEIVENWMDKADTTWYGSTATNYKIGTAEQLAGVAKLVNEGTESFKGKTLTLTADIDLAGRDWTPIGISDEYAFRGKLNGDDHEIQNLSISGMQDDVALFGHINTKQNNVENAPNTVEIYNLKLIDVNITGKNWVSALVAYVYSWGDDNPSNYLYIHDVSVSGISLSGGWYVGGIVGQCGSGGRNLVENCIVEGRTGLNTIQASQDHVGGIVGHFDYNAVKNCQVSSVDIKGIKRVGGIAGFACTDASKLNGYTGNTVSNSNIYIDRHSVDTSVSLYTGGSIFGGNGVMGVDESNKATDTRGFFRAAGTNEFVPIVLPMDGKAGTPIVAKASVISQGQTSDYATLADAVTASQEGDTIIINGDVTLDAAVSPNKSLTFEGVPSADGVLPVIKASGTNGLFSFAKDGVTLTLRGLNLQTAKNGNWTIYHSAGALTVDQCQFTMAEDVSYAGNLIIGEGGAKPGYTLTFTDNNVLANARAAIVGAGNGSVITGNTIDLISEHHGGGGRTSILSLTADTGPVVVTGNTFKNANRAVAVDNAKKMPASKLDYSGNTFIDVRYAFELGSTANAGCGTYDIANNEYTYNGKTGFPLAEDADAENASHFDDSSLYKGNQVKHFYTVTAHYNYDGAPDNTVYQARGGVAMKAPTAPERERYSLVGWYDAAQGGTAWNFSEPVTGDMDLYAQWSNDCYTVTLHPDNGAENYDIYVIKNTPAANPGDPSREGYTFDGWYTEDTYENKWDFNADVTSDMDLYAKWVEIIPEPVTYTVTFDSRDGSAVAPLTDVPDGTKITAPEAPTRSGYNFGGWYKDTDCTDAWNFNSDTVSADITLYAKWTEKSNSGGGGGGGGTTPTLPPTVETNPDGSTTKTETAKDGTVTETTEHKDGTVQVVETKPDGTVTESVKTPDGLEAKAVTSPEGKVEAEVVIPAAKAEAGTVELPISALPVTKDAEKAPVITVKSGKPVTVAVPVAQAAPGMVAVIVKADGTEEIVTKSVLVDGALVVPLEAGATVKLVDKSVDFADAAQAAWAGDAIAFVSSHELFQGTGEGSFSPNQPMNRAMLVTVLHRLESKPQAGVAAQFADVDSGAYYTDAVAWASESGIVTGTGAGFDPEAPISREQLAAILYRYMAKQGVQAEQGSLSAFADGGAVSPWAQEAMGYAVGAGLMTGKEGGILDPQGTATRAEVAVVLRRLVEAMAQ